MAFAKLNSMKFVGLDGLSHFWTNAKTWIINRITTEVAAKIAEIVAKEDLDTLKEIADWISSHANDAATMNTAISTNASDIATLKTTVAGKSDTGHTHTKSEITDFPTSLPANGGTADSATQDGSGNVITSTYVKKSGDTLTSSTSDTSLYVNTTASGKTKSWIGFQIGSVSKNYIGADQNGLYSYTNSKNNKILDTSAQTLTDEEKSQVRNNIGAGTSSLTIGTTATTAAAGNHTHSNYLTAHQDISGKLDIKTIANAEDIDTTLDAGYYKYPFSNVANMPVSNYGVVIVYNGNGSYIKQTFIPDSTNQIYYRTYTIISKTWSSWIAIANKSDIPASLPANGGTADSATNATNDSNGNNIANTYMPKSGGTFSGSVTFNRNVTFDSMMQGTDPNSSISFTPGDVEISAAIDIMLNTPSGNVYVNNGLIIDTDEIYIQSPYGYKRLDSYIKKVVEDSTVLK